MTYQLIPSEREALEFVVPDADAWVAHCEEYFRDDPGWARKAILEKIAKCRELYEKTPAEQRRTRVRRDAEEEERLVPTPLQRELAQAHDYAQMQADLAAARAMGLKDAEAHLTAELERLAK